MLNLQKSSNSKSSNKLSSYDDFQDSNDNFFLMNNLLNFDEDRRECESFLDTIRDREWLDLIDFKEEPAFFEDFNHPVKDSERKIKHNKIERARRLFIDAKIRELGFLLPKQNEVYHELAKEIKHNKGGILRATVTYVKILKSDQLKKQKLEEICRMQHEQITVIMDKIREYEGEMRSYQIPVKQFLIEDPPDYSDVLKPTYVPILTKKKIKKEKEAFKYPDVQVQVDDADDAEMVSNSTDPMLSSSNSSDSPSLRRSLSSESINDSEPLVFFKTNKSKPKAMKKEPRKIKKKPSLPPRPAIPDTIIQPPRMPVVSRPVISRIQSKTPTTDQPLLFPLPHELQNLPKLGSSSPVSFYSSSSEDERVSPTMIQQHRAPVQLSVIKKVCTTSGSDTDNTDDGGNNHGRRIILQER